jgi:hypothetical protein
MAEEKKGIRKRFNDKVREWGNNRTKRLKQFTGKGLGDLLAADINFKRIGATLGALAPVALCGLAADSMIEFSESAPLWAKALYYVPMTSLIYAAASYLTVPASLIAGRIGYELGKRVDNLRPNKLEQLPIIE